MELTRVDPSAMREVERTIAACKSALQHVQGELADAERNLGYKALRLRSLAGEIMASRFDEVLQEAEALRHQLAGKLGILALLRGSRPADAPEMTRLAALMQQIPGDENHPFAAPWREAYEALQSDATASLPK